MAWRDFVRIVGGTRLRVYHTLSIPEGLVIVALPMTMHDSFFVFIGYFEAAAATAAMVGCLAHTRRRSSPCTTPLGLLVDFSSVGSVQTLVAYIML